MTFQKWSSFSQYLFFTLAWERTYEEMEDTVVVGKKKKKNKKKQVRKMLQVTNRINYPAEFTSLNTKINLFSQL